MDVCPCTCVCNETQHQNETIPHRAVAGWDGWSRSGGLADHEETVGEVGVRG